MRSFISSFITIPLAAVTLSLAFGSPAQAVELDFGRSSLQADCTWIQGPGGSDESKLLVAWKNSSDQGAVEAPGTVTVDYYMPEMPDMKNPGPVLVQSVANDANGSAVGVFEASNIWFSMSGSWRVQVTLTMPNGDAEAQSFDVIL